ncbi:sulfatase [Cyclobacterium jeungdonense]|uniref:Sulfatase n=1 Tax=Cyclobacterium jeungdonense TaxID=708087 RepID=A0ABT8CEC7_9BACT|nr:sulfatase [Cyclobacterium jeungdonense]MDN3690046.1 sulfatase [Cyclobacterium jeungdonense]
MIRSLVFLLILSLSTISYAQENTNVLFIAIDDLNDWIGVLNGHPQTRTPNIDALAKSGMLFTNAHCQAPICGPSRASVMSGLYPTTSGNYLQMRDTNIKKSNAASGKAILLPDYFEKYGYKTMGVGKIYHNGDGAQTFDEYGGTFEMYGPRPPKRINYNPEWYGKPKGTSTDWGAYPSEDRLMPDYKSAQWAVEKLNQNHDKPFFLAVGFVRPHVPWHVPQKWFDKFPVKDIQTPAYLPDDFDDIPAFARRVTEVPMMPTTDFLMESNQWKDVVQAYLACINFVDHQVGKVLKALKESDYANNTIVVVWSDHGYHLGEKNRFAKQALWERSTRTVLIIKELNAVKGRESNKPVQLLDIYPTLLELSGLPANKQNEGHSLVPLLENDKAANWPYAAISSFGRNNTAITGENFRLIQYEDKSIELYDSRKDPNEWKNLAQVEGFEQEINRLRGFIPKEQADLSKYSIFNLNDYWRKIIKSNN